MTKNRKTELVVIRDGWLPESYFPDTVEGREAANKYRDWCNYAYQGYFEVRRCSEDHVRRFERATVGAAGRR